MDRYTCKGALSVTLYEKNPRVARIRMIHEDAHPRVADISISPEILKLIQDMRNSTPSDVSPPSSGPIQH